MITCDTARELLLEAEPAELRGEGDGALATHVRVCPACRERAAFVLAETEILHRTMEALRPSPHAAQGKPAGEATRRFGPGGQAEAKARRWRLLVPLALAAGVAGLLFARRYQTGTPAYAPVHVAAATPPALDVQVPAGQSVAVFQTANPNIVVIWSY